MGVNIFWPPLCVLAMGVLCIIVLILKYGDRFLKARSIPVTQNYEIENQSSENTNFDVEERFLEQDKDSMRLEMEIIPISEKKYECAV